MVEIDPYETGRPFKNKLISLYGVGTLKYAKAQGCHAQINENVKLL